MPEEFSELKKIYRVIATKGGLKHAKSSALFYGMIGVWLAVGVIVLVLGALFLGYRFQPFLR